MPTPALSVVIPVYNEEAGLATLFARLEYLDFRLKAHRANSNKVVMIHSSAINHCPMQELGLDRRTRTARVLAKRQDK